VDPKDEIPAIWPDFDVETMFRALSGAGVDYVVIGGIAMILHGSDRLTRDLDLVFAADEANLEKLGRALVGLRAQLRDVDEDIPFVPDAATLSKVDLLTLETSVGWLDVHRRPAGAPPYKTLRKRAEWVRFDGYEILVAAPADLQAMKRAAGRRVDELDLEVLDVIIRLRRERGVR
jgi:hypothetical protein